MDLHALSGLALVGAVVATLWWSWRPVLAWRLRNLPGPPRLPLLGNLPSILAKDITRYVHECAAIYGPVFVIWQGVLPIVVVTDLEVARRMLMKYLNRPNFNSFVILVGEDAKLVHASTISLKGAKWRIARKAYEAAVMHPRALAAQVPNMASCVARLVDRLDRFAASGEPCDVTRPLSDMTMDVTGGAAFGITLHTTTEQCAPDQDESSPGTNLTDAPWWLEHRVGSPEFGRLLVVCARTVFFMSNFKRGSSWKVLNLLAPMCGFAKWLANAIPDTKFKTELRARRGLVCACKQLMVEWRASSDQGKAAISKDGFLARLLVGDLASGEKVAGLDDLEVIAQAFTMVLAGYETTSSTLSACLHLLSTHPEAQTKAQAEIDHVLKGKAPTQEDIERLPYCCAVVNEALRLLPPGSNAVRDQVDADWDMGQGRTIPKGSFLWLPIYTFQRDPAIWPRADDFLPERFLGNEDVAPSNHHAFMPFGLGARMCVGYKLAEMEARLALVAMLQAYSFTPAPGCPPPKFTTAVVLSADHVWLSIAKRKSA